MLLIAIPIAWLTVIALVVAACQSASKGDARLFAAAGEDRHTVAPVTYRAERRTGNVSRELHLPAELTPSH
jgi:hypothetical protein